MTFKEHCIHGARQFLQTALVIDDRAELGDERDETVEPKVAVRKERTPIRRRSNRAQMGDEQEAPSPETRPLRGEPEDQATSQVAEDRAAFTRTGASSAARLDAKMLTDAFLKAEVICGVHKPVPGEESVELAVKAAKRADIVVVDWYLQDNNSTKAKEIIKGVLLSDVREHGRLRLIAVYTSEPGRALVAQELKEALETDEALKDCLRLDGTSLCSSDTRICIVNKEGTLPSQDLLAIPEKELPEHLLREFALLTNGLLANFAVSAVAAVRRGAHHVLASFRNTLDGVYVGHRISLQNPDEAEDMALERISIELSSLIENADVPGRTLNPEVIDAWLDARADDRGEFKNTTARISLARMKQLIREGVDTLGTKTGQEHIDGGRPPEVYISKKTIAEVFYSSPSSTRIAAREFARRTSYKREVGRVRLDEFKPRLTLGALLKVRRDLGRPELYADIEGDYLLCVQPRCDSVRLPGVRAFPFQQAKYEPKKFNIIVDGEGANGYLHIDPRPMGAVMLRFKPDEGSHAIFAKRNGESYLFTDERGRVLEWVGDFDDLKAQRFASDLGANMHRVGVDEFEWLRLGGKGEIQPEKRTPDANPAQAEQKQ